jgi:hypothetical protein
VALIPAGAPCGAGGLGLLVVAVSAWRFGGRDRWLGLGMAALALGAAVGWSLLRSTSTSQASPLSTAGRLVNAHAGAGVVPPA